MKLMLETLKGVNTDKIPIWFMRQAGRYLPEYIHLTETSGKNFFEIIEDTDLATKITMYPIQRFGFDSAIIFSDILFLPRAMGCNIEMVKDFGPKVEPIFKSSELSIKNLEFRVESISRLVKSVKNNLDQNTSLIGFAGGVFTVAVYIVGGTVSGKFNLQNAKLFMNANKKEFRKIIDILTESTIFYLNKQIENGAEIIQLFDSHAHDLSYDDFCEFIIEPTKKIFKNLQKCYKIGFPKGAGERYLKYVVDVGVDAISVDYTVGLDWICKHLSPLTVVQGNLDPYLLAFDEDGSILQTQNILSNLGEGRFIFNLGHGILKNTPLKNVGNVVELVKNYYKKSIN